MVRPSSRAPPQSFFAISTEILPRIGLVPSPTLRDAMPSVSMPSFLIQSRFTRARSARSIGWSFGAPCGVP
jgi:hypothetical protein